MTKTVKNFCSIAFLLLCFMSVAKADTYFLANMTGSQETPPSGSSATGVGRVTLNAAENQITASFYYSGLSSNVTAGHIHTGATGVAGPITFNMNPTTGVTAGSVVNATFSITPTQVADLKAGNMYFNVHTVNFSGGEIRGQILVDSPYLANMNGGQEVPASTSTARGFGAVSINTATNQAIVTMNWSGLTGNTTAAHYHSGRSGTSGPIVCNFNLSNQPTSGTLTDFLCTFTPTQITALKQGQMYLNIHTAANPGGEIRGQIQRRRSTVADFDGDGKTDYAVVRNNSGANQIEWYIANSGNGFSLSSFPLGISTDFSQSRVLAGDFDGDGKDDPTIWRSAAAGSAGFIIYRSSDNTVIFENFGQTSDDPRVIYDYDGDGKCDPAVYRSSTNTWYYRGSSNNPNALITFVPFGGGSFANPGDFDGDGKGDFVMQQSAVWWLLKSSDLSVTQIYIGTGGSFGNPGDYDGDGKTDVGASITEGSNLVWYYASSLNPNQNQYLTRQPWGPTSGRVRAQGDYNGDGKTDYGVFLTTTGDFWSISADGTNPVGAHWGLGTDLPVTGNNNR